jgi:hypothetical protein
VAHRPVCTNLLLLSLAVSAAEASSPFAATLAVDDSDAWGVLGDARLSLAEAIFVASGQLPLLDLSDAERAHIQGDPGALSADRIRVELGEGAILTTPAGASFALPILMGNDGDVLDGGGAILRPAGPLPAFAFGLFTLSSRIEIRRFSFDGYPFGILVLAKPGADALEDIRISRNHFSDYDNAVVVNSNQGGSQGLRGLEVDRNHFVGRAQSNGAIVVLGALPETPGTVAADYVVEDIVIRENEIDGGFGAIAVFGGQSRPGTTVRDGRLEDVRITGNEIRGVFDLSIAVYAGFALFGGVVSGIEVSDVRIADNEITTVDTPGSQIWVVSGVVVAEPGGLAENNHLRDLSIVGNTGSALGTCVLGIQLQASQNEVAGGVARGNVLERARVLDNSVAGCGNGLALFAGVAAAGHGLVEANELHHVRLFDNRLRDNRNNVIVAGAVGVEDTALPLPSSEPATLQGNRVHSIQIFENRIRGGVNGILAAGGISNFTSDVVIANSVAKIRAFDNSVRGAQFACRALDDILLGDAGGVAADNHAELECGRRHSDPH